MKINNKGASMNMKQITINGVTYNVSENQYKTIPSQISSAQRVEVASAPVAIEKEILTAVSLKRLFGVNYMNICVYNHDARKLLSKKYNGVEVYWDKNDIKNSERLKELIDNKFPEFELVAQVTMQVSDLDWPGCGEWKDTKKTVKFNKRGGCIVGNLVIRNKKTGALELYNSRAWFGVDKPAISNNVAHYMAFKLASNAFWDSGFRAALLERHCKTR